ncbi:MAG: putative toxin-antitoxin system toxin component, PIN family [Ignavibacteriales bacterium]|nr:putative toxin-antitoxin system toxin component, PIN family [Ignavibacteriales bacterium]
MTFVFKFAIINVMIITLDTNVLFSALYSSSGASHQILKMIIDEKLQVAISTPVYFEYYDVLSRTENLRKINLTIEEVEDVLDLLALLAKKYSIYFLLRPNLSDEKDNMFVECAFASNSQYLITSNVRDFKQAELKGFSFQLVTPGDFLKIWRENYE